MKKIITIWILLLLVLFPTFSFSQDDENTNNPYEEKQKKYLEIKKNDSVNDLWAKALWISLPYSDFESEDAVKLLKACLKKTENKAPIYVALGDTSNGPIQLTESFKKAVLTVTQGKPDEAVENIFKNQEENIDSSIYYYCQAVAEQPDYKIGWFKIAKYADGELKEIAVDKLIKLDHTNALPFYLKALIYEEKKDFKNMIKLINQGNSKKHCYFYQTEIPNNFNLVFHEAKFSKEKNIDGKPITYRALLNILNLFRESFAFMEPLDGAFRHISRVMEKEIKNLNQKGNIEESIHHLIILKQFGRKLILSTPRGILHQLAGVACEKTACVMLEKIYSNKKMNEELSEIRQTLNNFNSYHTKLGVTIDDMQNSVKKPELVFDGTIDLIKIEEKKLNELLISSGLLKPDPQQ